NPLHSNDAARSCPVKALLPLAALRGIEAFSLQVGRRATEAAVLGLEDLSPLLTDYAETAAAVANLDMVVSVDTSVAHLAAALGKPTWVMLPHTPEWRWLRDRSDTPWYECVRLFRQRSRGDWAGVVADVVHALASVQPSSRPASRSESLAAAV
ncbi:MAG: glycosyltransferase, partial [Acetobacteraceae bacterium]|nr:glycosyltransferase [Acetobacteraceae bacterium]